MFVAFSAWLVRVLCVYTFSVANNVPGVFFLPNCPLSAQKSIFGDKLSINRKFFFKILAYLIFLL